MENPEQVGRHEKFKRNSQSPKKQSFPEALSGGNSSADSKANSADEDQTNFDSQNREAEINPGELDRQEIDLDRSGVGSSQTHQTRELKDQRESPGAKDGNLSQGSNNRGVSGGAGGAQFGQGANTPGREDIDNQSQRNGVGGGNDSVVEKKIKAGNQNGGTLTGQAGPQNGSIGYNAGSQGASDNSLRGSNGGLDGEKSGKGSGVNRGKDAEGNSLQ